MKKEKIKKIAERTAREHVKLTDQAYIHSLNIKYVKIVKKLEKPSKIEIKKAWVAKLVDNGLYKDAWVEITLDEEGNLLKIDQSR